MQVIRIRASTTYELRPGFDGHDGRAVDVIRCCIGHRLNAQRTHEHGSCATGVGADQGGDAFVEGWARLADVNERGSNGPTEEHRAEGA